MPHNYEGLGISYQGFPSPPKKECKSMLLHDTDVVQDSNVNVTDLPDNCITFSDHVFDKEASYCLLRQCVKLYLLGQVSPESMPDMITVSGELIQNAVRHGSVWGSRVTVGVELYPHAVTFAVTDQGQGFDLNASRKGNPEEPHGLDLITILGEPQVDTTYPGCRVVVRVPIQEVA
jgi:anti-sigma regulatory factor (Ser/Thr protein kinase)